MMNVGGFFMDHGETDTQNRRKEQTDIETLALVSHPLLEKKKKKKKREIFMTQNKANGMDDEAF